MFKYFIVRKNKCKYFMRKQEHPFYSRWQGYLFIVFKNINIRIKIHSGRVPERNGKTQIYH